jgi:hypothetical protein
LISDHIQNHILLVGANGCSPEEANGEMHLTAISSRSDAASGQEVMPGGASGESEADLKRRDVMLATFAPGRNARFAGKEALIDLLDL